MPTSDRRRTDVHAPGARGLQVGDGNTQHNTFVLTAGALALVAVAGVALTFTYQGWRDPEKAASQLSPSASSSVRAMPGIARRPEPRTDTGTPTPTATAPSPSETATPSATPATAPAFDPRTLDDQATDRTPVSVAALLPDSFTDSEGVRYTRDTGGVQTCSTLSGNAEATAALAAAGCADDKVVTGTYTDSDSNVLVMVEVMALADQGTATAARARLESGNTGGWRYRCPTTGTGSGVCHSGTALSRATQYGYTGTTHRYLVATLAVYIDLRRDSGVKSWLTTASYRASAVAGPANYPGNR